MPAVSETAELVRSFRWIESLRFRPKVPASPRLWPALFLTGVAMLALTLLWPKWFYPLLWISLWLMFEPVNHWLGRRHLFRHLQNGDWRPLISLAIGALICGFFWEMWNYWSWPQWVYHTPGVEHLHIFKMPLLGYGGYIPFAFELYALMNFLSRRAPELKI